MATTGWSAETLLPTRCFQLDQLEVQLTTVGQSPEICSRRGIDAVCHAFSPPLDEIQGNSNHTIRGSTQRSDLENLEIFPRWRAYSARNQAVFFVHTHRSRVHQRVCVVRTGKTEYVEKKQGPWRNRSVLGMLKKEVLSDVRFYKRTNFQGFSRDGTASPEKFLVPAVLGLALSHAVPTLHPVFRVRCFATSRRSPNVFAEI